MNGIWEIDSRIIGDHFLKFYGRTSQLRSGFHLVLQAVLVGVCAIQDAYFVSLLQDKYV